MNENQPILLVEDNTLDAMLIERTLEINGYQGKVSIMGNVDEAVNYIKFIVGSGISIPKVIILDMFLEDGYGYEFLDFLDTIEADVKVIVITAIRQLVDVKSLEANKNVISVLDKPFRYEKFVELLEVHCA